MHGLSCVGVHRTGDGLQDWRTLKKTVEARFGLPRKALIDAFYNMRI